MGRPGFEGYKKNVFSKKKGRNQQLSNEQRKINGFGWTGLYPQDRPIRICCAIER